VKNSTDYQYIVVFISNLQLKWTSAYTTRLPCTSQGSREPRILSASVRRCGTLSPSIRFKCTTYCTGNKNQLRCKKLCGYWTTDLNNLPQSAHAACHYREEIWNRNWSFNTLVKHILHIDTIYIPAAPLRWTAISRCYINTLLLLSKDEIRPIYIYIINTSRWTPNSITVLNVCIIVLNFL